MTNTLAIKKAMIVALAVLCVMVLLGVSGNLPSSLGGDLFGSEATRSTSNRSSSSASASQTQTQGVHTASYPSPPPSKQACKNGGYVNWTDGNGNPFPNQGQCISYYNAND